MIKLFRDNNKFRLVNTEKVFINNKNELIFISSNIKFSFCDSIEDIGEFDDNKEMVNLIIDTDDGCDYIPIMDMEIAESVFEFIKKELKKITKYYGNILEYEIIESDKNVSNEELNLITAKEDVLKVEFNKVFDKWGMKIVYQNEMLKRGTFIDNDIKVSSNYNLWYNRFDDWLYILGKNIEKDDIIAIVTDEEKEIIENKVKLINEKYGIIERQRAEKDKVYYFIVGSGYYIDDDYDIRDNIDDVRYEIGNYFRTKELAENKLREIKELLLKQIKINY